MYFTADGGDIQDALSSIVGRRTVPQVFVKGKHIGDSDGKQLALIFLSLSVELACKKFNVK